ncbi:MAG: TetR family transcriptional regulator [Sandaracinaceae bacterium]|jgi:TetR/AcrR family transcriptional repressor of bet genes|nr:TetR family transcriptional regulator [Sandaracinaceae bacterium]MBK7155602.1 TetR family transcriptional regulator [Sandaracinaceae bacterium]MBK7776973.1 TetR family transcriptional regulator [Sandaracinaceae bacterium]MBP7685695.1 TetR family transcriptional regulator [Deltaproteobacteria bacterium]
MPRPSNTTERRAQIIEGLLDVIAADGYEGATIASIAKAAGLGSGLVHYHFSSKQAILLALIERIGELIEARYQRRLAPAGDDPVARLRAFIDAHLALGDDAEPRAVAAWVVVGAEALRQPAVGEVYRQVVAARLTTLEGLASDVLRARAGHARGAKEAAAGIMAAIEGAYQLAAAAPSAMPRGRGARVVERMALGLLDGES